MELDSNVCRVFIYKRKRVSAFIIDETAFRLVVNTSGYGSV